jgi:hypothetical protein
MSDLHHTAKRARDIALASHRSEVAHLNKIIKAWRTTSIITLCIAIGSLMLLLAYDPEPGWRGKQDAPPLQRVKVITTGFVDSAGQWHSFDNGTPITVHLWKP